MLETDGLSYRCRPGCGPRGPDSSPKKNHSQFLMDIYINIITFAEKKLLRPWKHFIYPIQNTSNKKRENVNHTYRLCGGVTPTPTRTKFTTMSLFLVHPDQR